MPDQRSGLAALVARVKATTVEVQHHRYAGRTVTAVVDVEVAARAFAVREVADPHHVAPERRQRRHQNPTPRPARRRRIVERGVSPKRPPDDHHKPEKHDERRDSDDDAAHGIEITLCQCKDSRCDQQVAGKERQLVEHQRRDSRELRRAVARR